MLGPKRLATRGLANSVDEMLRRLPERLKAAKLVHFHAGKHSAELKETLKDWFSHGGAVKLRERAPYSEPGVVSPLVRKLSL